MARDPLANVVDAPLFIVPRVLDGLRAYRARAPSGLLVALADTLLAGIEAHPTKFWVMRQFQKTLERVADEDAAACGQVHGELEQLMDVLGIRSSDGVLGSTRR
jgi:hypothetical protein